MVGLFVATVVALLAGVAALVTGNSTTGIALIVVGVLCGAGALFILRSFSPEDRAVLTPPKDDPPEAPATDDQAPEDPR